MRRVVLESPLMGHVPHWVPWFLRGFVERVNRIRNMRYAMRCVRDSLYRLEAPYASHVFFDRSGLLDDAKPEEREAGIEAGFAWGAAADLRAVYCDRGISNGMLRGITQRPATQPVVYRYIETPPEERKIVGCPVCGYPQGRVHEPPNHVRVRCFMCSEPVNTNALGALDDSA